MFRVVEPAHQCSATVDVMRTYGKSATLPIGWCDLTRGYLSAGLCADLRVQQVLDRALDGLVHLGERPVLRHVRDVARVPRMLLVGILVDGREETPDALGAQVEGALAVRRVRAVGQDGDVGHVVARPALLLLVPPDDRLACPDRACRAASHEARL